MGAGGGVCTCVIDGFVRSLAVADTDVYVGTDVKDVAGIAQADNVVRWDGAGWSAVGANSFGTDGWFPTLASVYGLAAIDGTVVATGSFQDADGNPAADNVAAFGARPGTRSGPTAPATARGSATAWRSPCSVMISSRRVGSRARR